MFISEASLKKRKINVVCKCDCFAVKKILLKLLCNIICTMSTKLYVCERYGNCKIKRLHKEAITNENITNINKMTLDDHKIKLRL